MPDILFIGGPTASGKSALGLDAARRLDGEIVNADSMQVYERLSILSARPTPAEMEDVPHHLFGVLDPGERCSVGRWAQMALETIAALRARAKRAIFVGGTGLYFKALSEGLAPAPEIPAAVREEVTADLERKGLDALRAEAFEFDPQGAGAIEPGDRQRLQRIVEIGRTTGKALSELQAETRPLIAPESWRGVVVSPPREDLYARIEARFDQMMAAGALKEARAIAALDLSPDLPAMKAVGLPPLLAHLRGEISLEDAMALAKRDTRRYAKRQFTWFANQHPGWARITSLDPARRREELEALLSREFTL